MGETFAALLPRLPVRLARLDLTLAGLPATGAPEVVGAADRGLKGRYRGHNNANREPQPTSMSADAGGPPGCQGPGGGEPVSRTAR